MEFIVHIKCQSYLKLMYADENQSHFLSWFLKERSLCCSFLSSSDPPSMLIPWEKHSFPSYTLDKLQIYCRPAQRDTTMRFLRIAFFLHSSPLNFLQSNISSYLIKTDSLGSSLIKVFFSLKALYFSLLGSYVDILAQIFKDI